MTTIFPGRYRHYKGKEYTVIGAAQRQQTTPHMKHAQWVKSSFSLLGYYRIQCRFTAILRNN
jgi:hypothetical protein